MELLAAVVLFGVVVVLFTVVGSRLWVRPQAAIDRVTRSSASSGESTAARPPLSFGNAVKRLSDFIPRSPKDVRTMERRLVRAGYRGPGALKAFYGSKVLLGLLLPAVMAVAATQSASLEENQTVLIAGAALVGFLGPNQFITAKAKRRKKQLRRGLPNALDLMVVCVESGLGLDQAIMQTAKELEKAHPEISQEFAMVNFELRAGKRRVEALRNLAERAGVDDLKKLVAVLVQADRFGTGIAQSLRAHSDYMRVQARQVAEEKAAKLGVKLVFPIFFCILPALFVVTVGPVIVRITRELLPMMRNM